MYFIYNCYGGAHSSVTAACLHVGLLKESTVPSYNELIKLPYFDRQTAKDHGHLRFIGKDKKGNKIYIASKHNLGKSYEKIMRGIISISNISNEDIIFVDTMPYVNWLMVVGGFLSRRLGFEKIGRPIVVKGTQLSFYKFAHLVNLVNTKYGRYNKQC